jgi:hypothetical protein
MVIFIAFTIKLRESIILAKPLHIDYNIRDIDHLVLMEDGKIMLNNIVKVDNAVTSFSITKHISIEQARTNAINFL